LTSSKSVCLFTVTFFKQSDTNVAYDFKELLNLQRGDIFSAVIADYQAVDGAEHPHLLIKNPSNSTCVIRIISLEYTVTVSGSVNASFRHYMNPTITSNGTALTIVPIVADAVTGTTSQAQLFLKPTLSSNGTYFRNVLVGPTQTIFSDIPIVLFPGKSLAINMRGNSASAFVSTNVIWTERS
jgi:hypothetical protein